jgi:hypothetical protein
LNLQFSKKRKKKRKKWSEMGKIVDGEFPQFTIKNLSPLGAELSIFGGKKSKLSLLTIHR